MAISSNRGPVDVRPLEITNQDDVEQCIALHRVNVEGGTLPDFGAKNQSTYVFKDRATKKVIGFAHIAHITELRAVVTDRNYEFRAPALTIGIFGLEMLLAALGISEYYITVPEEHKYVQRYYDQKNNTQTTHI